MFAVGPFWNWKKVPKERKEVLRFLARNCLDHLVRRSCWDLMVRRMLLVVVELGIDFDERPFVRLPIEKGVYGVRGIRDASDYQPLPLIS